MYFVLNLARFILHFNPLKNGIRKHVTSDQTILQNVPLKMIEKSIYFAHPKFIFLSS